MTADDSDDRPAAIGIEAFLAVDIRCGVVVDAQPFPEARKPAIRLWIDFGLELGVRQSSAQITERYSPQDLPGRRVMAVVNLPPRRIGPFVSEVLTLGFSDGEGAIVLADPGPGIAPGARLH